jgi:hypothetical protein
VDADAKDDDGQTTLHLAAENGHKAEVRLLLEHKADVNAKTMSGKMALYLAAAAGAQGRCRREDCKWKDRSVSNKPTIQWISIGSFDGS